MENIQSQTNTLFQSLIYMTLLTILTLLVTTSVSAGLITTNNAGYSMTDFVLPSPNSGSANSATSLDGDVVQFTTKNAGSSLSMQIGDVLDNTVTGDEWWSGSDSTFYYTNLSNVNWLEIIMPANTLGFSLSIDASARSRAWILGVADDNSAIDSSGTAHTLLNNGDFFPNPSFNLPLNGPVQTAGFYADNSAGSCNTISKVVIDPIYWGMGDFSIHVDDNACTTDVPEPSVLALFGLGLAGLGFMRRKISK